MSEQQHTPEPWSHMAGIKTNIIASTGVRVARCDFNGDFDNSEAHANARRIVACVNALEGVSTEALEILIAQGNGKYALNVEATQAKVKKLEAQLDELLLSLRGSINHYNNYGPEWTSRETGQEYYSASTHIGLINELIAKIEAEKAG